MSNAWDNVGRYNCEGLYTGFPEYASAFTAIIFITSLGAWGLFASHVKYDIVRILYACLLLNGPSSSLWHWNGFNAYGSFDTFTITLACWLVTYLAFRALITQIFYYCVDNNNRQERARNILRWYPLLDNILDLVALICMLFVTFLNAQTNVSGKIWNIQIDFAEGFAIAEITTTALCVAMCIINRRDTPLIIYLSVGLVYLLLAVIMWVSTEPACVTNGYSKNVFERYTHALWHVFSIHSSHLIVQSIIYLNLISTGRTAQFVKGNNCFTKAIYLIFPIAESCNYCLYHTDSMV